VVFCEKRHVNRHRRCSMTHLVAPSPHTNMQCDVCVHGDPCVWFAMLPSCADDGGDNDLAKSYTISAWRICSTVHLAFDVIILRARVLLQRTTTFSGEGSSHSSSMTPAQHPSSQPAQRTCSSIQPISARSIIHRSKANQKQSNRYIHIRTPRSTL
jgi:hypothetical protein